MHEIDMYVKGKQNWLCPAIGEALLSSVIRKMEKAAKVVKRICWKYSYMK